MGDGGWGMGARRAAASDLFRPARAAAGWETGDNFATPPLLPSAGQTPCPNPYNRTDSSARTNASSGGAAAPPLEVPEGRQRDAVDGLERELRLEAPALETVAGQERLRAVGRGGPVPHVAAHGHERARRVDDVLAAPPVPGERPRPHARRQPRLDAREPLVRVRAEGVADPEVVVCVGVVEEPVVLEAVRVGVRLDADVLRERRPPRDREGHRPARVHGPLVREPSVAELGRREVVNEPRPVELDAAGGADRGLEREQRVVAVVERVLGGLDGEERVEVGELRPAEPVDDHLGERQVQPVQGAEPEPVEREVPLRRHEPALAVRPDDGARPVAEGGVDGLHVEDPRVEAEADEREVVRVVGDVERGVDGGPDAEALVGDLGRERPRPHAERRRRPVERAGHVRRVARDVVRRGQGGVAAQDGRVARHLEARERARVQPEPAAPAARERERGLARHPRPPRRPRRRRRRPTGPARPPRRR